MNFLEYLDEIAFPYKKLEDIITGKSEPIVLHIIKILAFDDKQTKQKHLNDIDDWINNIVGYPSRCKRQTLTKRYAKWIIFDWLGDVNKVERTIRHQLLNYHNLPRLRNAEDIQKIISDSAESIGHDVAMETYTTITDYIQELDD